MQRASLERQLIVTADDFGLNRSVNEAVEQAAAGGVLTAASLMVGAPAAADAVAVARRQPQLQIGLHLVLTDGQAVLPPREIPDLTDSDGRFRHGMVQDSFRYVLSATVRRQLAAEIRAQFRAFAATGLELDHVNTHKHLHFHPLVLAMIVRIGSEFGLTAVRVPAEPLWFAARAGAAASVSTALLSPWLQLMKVTLRRASLAHNDHVFGISCSGHLDEDTLVFILQNLPPGSSEIYLHPATSAKGVGATSDGAQQELCALLSERVRETLRAGGAQRCSFGDLRKRRPTQQPSRPG
jgi:chitin disaccharide deacetylase